jgi:hypothetical protein
MAGLTRTISPPVTMPSRSYQSALVLAAVRLGLPQR